MPADSFLDTNILVYALDRTARNAKKRAIALELLAEADFGLSAQILQEFYVTVTGKIERPLSPEKALGFIDALSAFPLVVVDRGLVIEGIRNALKYQLSYWDGTIVAAAERLYCRLLYSEDLNHGQIYGSVELRNPFISRT